LYTYQLIDTFQFNRLVNVSFKEKKKYLIVVIIYDLIYYIPVLIYIDLIETNSTNYNSTIIISKTCSYRKAEQLMIVSVMDTINRVLPFSLMFASSLLLIYCLFKSRTRIVENFLAEENKTFYTEIRLATVLSNSLFRDEFFNLFKKTKKIRENLEMQIIN